MFDYGSSNLLKRKIKINSTDLISFVKDRPGHDIKYSIDNSKIKRDLKWTPKYNLDASIKKYYKMVFT